jgi:hypothetical protein
VLVTSRKFILDQILAAPNSAYSLRRLTVKYNGPIITVRRSSDSATMNIYTTPNGDLDTAAILAFVGSNTGFVTTWFDQSGLGNNATQSTAADQPYVVLSGALQTNGGVAGVRFTNGAATSIYIASFKFAAPSTNFTFNEVGSTDTVTGNTNNVFGTDTNNGFTVSGMYKQVTKFAFNRSGVSTTVTAGTPSAGSLFISTLTYTSGNTATSYLNGVAGTPTTSINYTNGAAGVWQMGNFALATNSDNLKGYISEHITFPSVISTADQKNLEFSQANYYKIVETL